MCAHSQFGAYGTQAVRVRSLCLIADQLKELGFRLKHIKNLKPKHVTALVDTWQASGLASGTLKNRMSHLRYWAENVGKASIIKSNEDYGLENRTLYNGDKAQRLDMEKLATIQSENIKLSLRLQSAFGLRREEALKFQPRRADKGEYIALAPSWCKGGRAREIPITTERQRKLLEEAHALAGAGSLIPDNKSYKEHLQTYKHQTLKAGLKNNHGLRHNYAQWRYKVLTGQEPPAISGREFASMSNAEKARDTEARQIISRELGHERLEVTNVYLGGRR